ncbi:MAG: hypothetical protein ACKOFF_01455 [Acidimicrobiales bacterium]
MASEGNRAGRAVSRTQGVRTVQQPVELAVENGEVSITYIGRLDDVPHHGTEEIHGELDGLLDGSNTLRS